MITNIKLDNFKIFKGEDFDIAPLTLITGINGMGKSSIIQSLLLLKQSYANTLLQTQSKVDLVGDFINMENAEELCYELSGDTNKNVGITITYKGIEPFAWCIDASKPKQKILDCIPPLPTNITSLSLFSPDFIYLDAERWGPKEEYLRKEKRTYNTKLGIQGELTPAYLLNAINTNEQIGIKELNHSSIPDSLELYDNLNAWMSEILSLPLKTKVEDISEDKVKLSYNIEGFVGKSHPALQVGFGLTYCLPVILAPLIAKQGDLIVIENPEAHLHPAAQAKIGKLLALAAKNGVQVIIETHSDHLLNGIRVAVKKNYITHDLIKLIFLSLSGDSGDKKYIKEDPVIDKDGRIEKWPLGFFDTWEYSLMELL